jgi:hypothetical protein
MDQEELLTTLKTLHAQLSSAGEIDAETQSQLQAVTADIQQLLEDRQVARADESGAPFTTRIRETLMELEARHPTVGGLLERITDGLAGMGI